MNEEQIAEVMRLVKRYHGVLIDHNADGADVREAEEAIESFLRSIKEQPPILSQAVREGWQPIETAPKDGTNVVLFCPRSGINAPGKWETQEYKKRPNPYWTHLGEYIFGVGGLRADQPTHWMPLPPPPAMLAAAPKEPT